MSNGGPPPICDLACQTKIIINGDNIGSLVDTVCKQTEYARDHGIDLGQAGADLVKLFNKIEDMACQAQVLILRGFNYKGEVGKMLQP